MKKQSTNLLVGAKVCIDYPNRWRGARTPELQAQMRAETEASKTNMEGRGAYYFGETGVVVNYNRDTDNGADYDVLLDSSHELVHVHGCEFTVQEMPKAKDEEILACLTEIQNALRAIGKDGMELLTRLATQLEKIERKSGH